MRLGGLLFSLCCATGCSEASPFTHSLKLHDRLDAQGNAVPGTGEVLSTQMLSEGYAVFMRQCAPCHGERGDGSGPAALGMRPPPRNFAVGQFKFTDVGYGELPSDAALRRTIRRGLHGTPMAGWDLSPRQLDAVIGFIKALSPRWKEDGRKPEIEVAADPWVNRPKTEAIAMGRRVFHVAVGGAGCSGCHASFESKAVLSKLYDEAMLESPDLFHAGQYETGLKASAYPSAEPLVSRVSECTAWLWNTPADADALTVHVNGHTVDRDPSRQDGWDYVQEAPLTRPGVRVPATPVPTLRFFGAACKMLKRDSEARITAAQTLQLSPPSFLFHRLKTVWPLGARVKDERGQEVQYTEVMQREDLYRTIAAGIGGASMPGWKGVIEEEMLWSLVYYVQSLAQLRGTQEALAIRAELEAQTP